MGAAPGRGGTLERGAERGLAEASAASADWFAREAGWGGGESTGRGLRRQVEVWGCVRSAG